MKTLIIIAHQDDEFFIASRIAYDLAHGHHFDIVYMTNGCGHGSKSDVRNSESTAALKSLGIPADRIHFLGTEFDFADGQLFKVMPSALQKLDDYFHEQIFDQVYLSAWEGGHPDHDACHLIGMQFARRRAVAVVREFSLYNGFGTKFLRVSSLIPDGRRALISRNLSFPEAWAAFSLIKYYKSQLQTWFALAIPAAISLLILRRECLREVDMNEVSARPHAGRLFYEKAFGVHYPDLESEARSFVQAPLH